MGALSFPEDTLPAARCHSQRVRPGDASWRCRSHPKRTFTCHRGFLPATKLMHKHGNVTTCEDGWRVNAPVTSAQGKPSRLHLRWIPCWYKRKLKLSLRRRRAGRGGELSRMEDMKKARAGARWGDRTGSLGITPGAGTEPVRLEVRDAGCTGSLCSVSPRVAGRHLGVRPPPRKLSSLLHKQQRSGLPGHLPSLQVTPRPRATTP